MTIKILLLGPTGSGKSLFGNMFLQHLGDNSQPFIVSKGSGGLSETQDRKEHAFGDFIVVDEPGFCDTGGPEKDASHKKHFIDSLKEQDAKINAIIFVVDARAERIPSSVEQCIDDLVRTFTHIDALTIISHMLFIVTHAHSQHFIDQQKNFIKSIEKFVRVNWKEYRFQIFPIDFDPRASSEQNELKWSEETVQEQLHFRNRMLQSLQNYCRKLSCIDMNVTRPPTRSNIKQQAIKSNIKTSFEHKDIDIEIDNEIDNEIINTYEELKVSDTEVFNNKAFDNKIAAYREELKVVDERIEKGINNVTKVNDMGAEILKLNNEKVNDITNNNVMNDNVQQKQDVSKQKQEKLILQAAVTKMRFPYSKERSCLKRSQHKRKVCFSTTKKQKIMNFQTHEVIDSMIIKFLELRCEIQNEHSIQNELLSTVYCHIMHAELRSFCNSKIPVCDMERVLMLNGINKHKFTICHACFKPYETKRLKVEKCGCYPKKPHITRVGHLYCYLKIKQI